MTDVADLHILQGRPRGTQVKYGGELRHIYSGLDTIVPFECTHRWLREQWPQVVARIKAQTPSRSHFQFAMLSGLMKNRDPALYADAHRLQGEFPGKAASSELTEREEANWVDFRALKKLAKEFDERVGKLKGPLTRHEDITLLYQQLMLAMSTDVAPMRNEISEMRVVASDRMGEAAGGNVLEALPRGKFMIHLRRYKTVGRYGEQVLDLPPKVEKTIARSLKLLPREWVLTKLTDTGRPLGGSSMSMMFASILPDKRLGSSLARKIYISHHFRNDKTWQQREQLAARMQHSAGIAASHYQKVTAPSR